ncbi:meiosis protein SPO22/ZIP4 like-domain-containing protein [Fusarium tricinctum]|uniref:Protein ZIP4 homolog n=1 Tax=Fusarium tricinctum TaxID=61284 RepID=A0A8K0WFK2_9HYPO|nr:meiosis protein SPO22/ZIP4 like-domain-containing protein [Fusarium tricinctum]
MTDRNAAAMGKSVKQEPAKDDDGKTVNRDKSSNTAAPGNHKTPTKKRRKVNHGTSYKKGLLLAPCTRCIKRNIGHLCHDEPRDADSKKAKSVQSTQSIQTPSVVDETDAQSDMARSSISSTMGPPPPTFDTTRQRAGSKSFGGVLGQGSPLSIVQPGQVSGLQGNVLNNGNSNANQFAGFQDAWMTAQNHFHDMHSYHPNYMIAPEVTHEFNLLNDFLHTSLLDDGGVPPEDQHSPAFKRSSQSQSEMLPRFGNNNNANSMAGGGSSTMPSVSGGAMLPPPPNAEGKNIPRPGSVVPADKAREYYLQAADPSGNDTPEERMARVLKAKYDAGLLKPFNYIKGYARLGTYLDSHIAASSKQKILRTIDRFRPLFREKAHALTDMELVYVEMWFEKQLMDYDRVFASMAVPACCWRRTGEIFRGNKEMAELIGVSVAQLRDGKIALHEILTEESMVRYWEEFGTIAFDPAHETLLTACSLKNPNSGSSHPIVKCCFSFMIRRDEHKLYFATDLLSKLPTSCDSISIDVLLSDLNHHISTANTLIENRIVAPVEISKDLRDIGRRLWNECIKARRRRDDLLQSPLRLQLQVRARVLAFLAHALAREHRRGKSKDNMQEIIYMMGLSLTLARVCVESSDLEGALLSMAKAADYIERLKGMENVTGEDQAQIRKIEAEYMTMRCALSWKQGRLDVAEHMFAKANTLLHHLDPSSAEQLADTFHSIGTDLSSRNDYDMALKWLRRALGLINEQELERLSTEGLELRMAIHHELIQALLATEAKESLQEADELASLVESEIGDKPVVLHWKLEILQKSPSEVFNEDSRASILRRMIRSLDLSDAGLGFLLHGISELRTRGPRLAVGLMEELILKKLIPAGNMNWIGKALVRRVWMAMMETDTTVSVADLIRILDQVAKEAGQCNVDVATAALSQYPESQLWCRLALHPIFSTSGDASQGKFSRRLMLCAIACNDAETAHSAFHTMPKSIQDEPLTRYLMFKVSLLNWDQNLGCQCITFLSKLTGKSQCRDILYACVKEAQNVGHRLLTLEALKAVAETFDGDSSWTINMPSIFRCIIRLIHTIESQDSDSTDQTTGLAEETCRIFEKAGETAKLHPKDERGDKIFTVPELHCILFVSCYPSDVSSEDDAELRLMAARCHFVIAAALVSQARTEDRVDEQLQNYLEARQHVSEFESLFESHFRNDTKSQVNRDLLAKLSTLFVFDFESAIYLKNWDDLGQIVRKARICKDEIIYKAMGDCLLRSEALGNVVYSTMRLIINEIFSLEQFDNQRLAKYIRCMFQAILPLNENLALQVVDQAVQIAREGSQMQKPFPAEDLDWIIPTIFNHGIDILARGDRDLCQQWTLKALDLAEYVNDGGNMRDTLRERVVKLNLSQGASD